jgi:hypothetical protein
VAWRACPVALRKRRVNPLPLSHEVFGLFATTDAMAGRHYSYLSATDGLTLAARRAGMKAARAAIAISRAETAR